MRRHTHRERVSGEEWDAVERELIEVKSPNKVQTQTWKINARKLEYENTR